MMINDVLNISIILHLFVFYINVPAEMICIKYQLGIWYNKTQIYNYTIWSKLEYIQGEIV